MPTASRSSTAVLLAMMSIPFGSFAAEAQAPIPPGTDIVATGNDHGKPRLGLLSGGSAKIIFTDQYALIDPAFSPDGQNIAFDRGVRSEHAVMDIVVIDRRGKVLSSTFINKFPLGEKKIYNTRGVSDIHWMSDGRLAVLAQQTPEKEIGIIFKPPSNTSLDDGPDLLDSSAYKMFDNDGPLAISPSGAHVATFNGLAPQPEIGLCAGFGMRRQAVLDFQAEAIEIDGSDLDDFGKPISPLTNISWLDDTKFSIIVLDTVGVEVLTLSNVPSVLQWKNGKLTNPPIYTFSKIAMAQGRP